MRIGMVVSHFQQEFGGHEYYLCNELARLGHQVTVFTSNRTRPEYSSSKFLTAIDDVTEKFNIKRFNAPLEVSDIPLMVGLSDGLIDAKLDLIHSHEFFQSCSFIAYRIAARKGIPFILTQHAMGHLPLKKYLWLPYTLNKKIVGKYLFTKSDSIITLSSKAKLALVASGADANKVNLIHTGVSTDLFTPDVPSILSKFGISHDQKVVLFVGRLVENKGIHILIESFAKVRKKIGNARLVVVGQGKLESYLKAYVKREGLESDVFFLGKVNQKEMPGVYSGAHVFVLPTLYTEPFGIAAIEALSSGVPVIASDLEGLSDIVKDKEVGYLVSPSNIDMLASSIAKLLENDDIRNAFSRNARARALGKFSWKSTGRLVNDLYNQTLKKRLS